MRTSLVVIVTLLLGATACACPAPKGGAPTPRDEALAIVAKIEREPAWFGIGASNVATFRQSIERLDEAKALVRIGMPAAEVVTGRFTAPAPKNGDAALACYAYVIEKTGHAAAKPTLEEFLRSSPGTRLYTWSPMFAVRALLVLKGLKDETGGYREYPDADVVRAITSP